MASGIGIVAGSVGSSIPSVSNNQAAGSTEGFGQFLQNALDSTNQLSNQADAMSASYVAGGPVSVDQLMIAEQKASLALDTVVQVRNRVVSAYQSIMNMQV